MVVDPRFTIFVLASPCPERDCVMNRSRNRLPNGSRRRAPAALAIAALLAVAVLLVMAPGAFALEAVRTNPAHRGRAPVWPLDVPPAVPPTVYEGGGYLVIKTDRKLAEVAALEPRLTDLCRFGLFH